MNYKLRKPLTNAAAQLKRAGWALLLLLSAVFLLPILTVLELIQDAGKWAEDALDWIGRSGLRDYLAFMRQRISRKSAK